MELSQQLDIKLSQQLDIIKSHYIDKYCSAAQSRMENKYLKYKHKYLLLKNKILFN